MASILLRFIKQKFDQMPEWLQISTFIVFITSFLALIFTPKYIDIRLVGTLGEGEFPLAEARVEIETHDRVITMVTDTKGRFSVPIGLANPITEYTFVLYPDSKTMRQVDVKVSGHQAFKKWNKLTYSKDTDTYSFELTATPAIFSHAQAQSGIEQFRATDEIDDVVLDAIANSLGIQSHQIDLQANLYRELGLGNYEMSYISYRLKEAYKVDAWEDIWNIAETPEDIIGITRAAVYQDKPWEEHLIWQNKNIEILLNEAGNIYPGNVYNAFLTARTLRKSGDLNASIDMLENILKQHPDLYLVNYNLALAYSANNANSKAMAAFNKSIQIQNTLHFREASLYDSYGRHLYDAGQYKKALLMYQKALQIEPQKNTANPYINAVLTQLNCESVDECLAAP